MDKRLAGKELIDQISIEDELDDSSVEFASLSEFLEHVELGVRVFVRVMVQRYGKDEFLSYIGAKPYERSARRKD